MLEANQSVKVKKVKTLQHDLQKNKIIEVVEIEIKTRTYAHVLVIYEKYIDKTW